MVRSRCDKGWASPQALAVSESVSFRTNNPARTGMRIEALMM